MNKINFFSAVLECLLEPDLQNKLSQLNHIQIHWSDRNFSFDKLDSIIRIPDPGRPVSPKLVAPKNLPKRKLGSKEGQISLMHSIAHIEFNAINLALDALYRFQEMPLEYYEDWLGVAGEEAYHFQMIREHLLVLGAEYGDLPAHDGLWMTTYETDHDILVRMALVPRTLEARGLDVTPPMIKKLRAIGDKRGVEILKILLRDEIGHVAVGTRWFRYLCEQRNMQPFETFKNIINEYFHGDLRGPFNYEARSSAGFDQKEIDWLQSQEKG